MKLVHSFDYEVDIGPHVFPTSKYRLVREKLLHEGLVADRDFLAPHMAPRDELLLVHTSEFLDDMEQGRVTRRTAFSELPLRRPIVDAYVLAAGGTTLASRTALDAKLSGNLPGAPFCAHIGGGFHHAFADHAEGFCYINDIAVAIRVAQRSGRVRHALVIDLDLHQGNGTAHIFEHDPTVFTISLHQENNYPAKQRSDIDVGLPDGAGDEEYLTALNSVFPTALERHAPDLVIYVAGADPYEDDQLGGLSLSLEGLRRRDEAVLRPCAELRIPTVVVFAGGYAHMLNDTVEIHTQTVRSALQLAG